ncbi:MAG: hypothetical protein HY288_07100 [Planctomycetia bacterium]|nr:hypothetical protein [Planctomycetia bacterium]
MFAEVEFAPARGRHISAVLIAAAIDHEWLCPGERYGVSTSVAEEILVLTNRKDCCLRWYPLFKARPGGSLGCDGLSDQDKHKLEAVAGRVRVVSIEDQVGSNHNFRTCMEPKAVAQLVVSAFPVPPWRQSNKAGYRAKVKM